MKGTVKLYFNAPNIAKVRSRVENPSKEFSAEMRQAIQEAAQEVLNDSLLKTRQVLIAKFQKLGLTVKDAKQAAAIANPLGAFFDCVYSATPFAEAASDEAEESTAEAASDEAEEATAEAAPESSTDEFED